MRRLLATVKLLPYMKVLETSQTFLEFRRTKHRTVADWKKMIRQLLLSFLLIQTTLVAARGRGRRHPAVVPPPAKKWLTLNGGEPVVVARGGFSGIAPESSLPAYSTAQQTSLASTILLCDLQLTKDAQGFCQSSLNLQNATTIATAFPDLKPRTYNINGKNVEGFYGVDFLADDLLKNVFCKLSDGYTELQFPFSVCRVLSSGYNLVQSIYSRSPGMDGSYPLLTPYDVVGMQGPPPVLWMNVECCCNFVLQYPSFYDGLKLSSSAFIIDTMRDLNPAYISSPEIGFLKGLVGKVNPAKLIFKIPDINEVEPTTKKTYVTLLSDINMIKTFASGIILPKESIWPVDSGRLLLPATSSVSDFHKAGVEVYASGFANDDYLSYNYSYDPTKEYLQFIDNSQFSVDGVITDFPATASESIACLAQNKNAPKIVKALIISDDGASGDYPGSTDLAYQKAIDDGTEIIDCSVQLSKDGTAFCLPSADLIGTTTAASLFMDRSTRIPEIQDKNGIFSFDLTWTEIQSLKPQLASVFDGPLARNPANKNAGKFVTLNEFLDLAKKRAVTGVLINIENAAYLASNKGLDIVGAVTTALSNATLDKQSTQKVLIQSDDSSVLSKFQDIKTYQRVLAIDKDISGSTQETAQEVKKYADAVKVFRNSIVLDYPNPVFMSLNYSNLVEVMHAANISVYVGILRNEFQNFLFDYYADPYVELATLTQKGVDGIVTDYPSLQTVTCCPLLLQGPHVPIQMPIFHIQYYPSIQVTCLTIWLQQNLQRLHPLYLSFKMQMSMILHCLL
nr:glycerophosphodiester phosphodiesterase GDPDL7-like [Coffea arabica]